MSSARRPHRLIVLPAILIVAFVVAACATSPSPAPTASPAPPSGQTVTVHAYFFLGNFADNGGLVPVERQAPRLEPAGATERGAIEALLAGPSETERGAPLAMYTVIPEGTRLLDLALDAGVATIDLSSEFGGAGSASARGRLAQVVYTLTQFESISGVRFEIDGEPTTAFSEVGIDPGAAVDRSTFTDQLPAIFVDQPAWGGTLANPARLVGLANVFEASFHVRILDATGRVLADSAVMASCGTGCWGTFDTSIPYPASATSAGVLQVYEPSAADGSPVNVTEYPVTFTP